MTQSKTQKIIKDTNGNEVAMIRIDKTLKEVTEEKPSSRWDVDYWHPYYEEMIKFMSKQFTLKPLSNFIIQIQQGDVPRKAKGDKYVKQGVIYINVAEVNSLGINWPKCKRIIESHYNRIKRAEPKIGDLIFVRSGKGSIGKSTIFAGIPNETKVGISGHLNTVKLKNINPFYVECFLKGHYGQKQIGRFEAGTSQQTDFRQDSFAAVKIPILDESIQQNIEMEYRTLAKVYNNGLEAYLSGNEAEYKRNIEKAEKMLRELISRTEAIIRGERKDVI